jgi:Fur family ferric uptake transcriptional regulator
MAYKTKQRELILNYLKENKNHHVVADDIAEHLKIQGNAVGKSTVYRYLDRLVNDGIVKKYFTEEGKSACYQYSENNNCNHHYHFKCTECGCLFHVECSHLDDMGEHIYQSHKFKIDLCKTVIYGICEKCNVISQEV